jgi:hypothetical protein
MESVLAVILGIGLAASCGFRVFAPLLIVSVAARSGYLELGEGFAWLGAWPALLAFAVATLIEIGAYYIPWLDNLLDTVATPAAVVAGTVLFAAVIADFDPLLQWSLAIIAGGGSAGIVQGGTVAARAASTTATGGAANPVVNTLESFAGLAFSILSLAVPVLALLLLIVVVGVLYYLGRRVLRKLFRRRQQPIP